MPKKKTAKKTVTVKSTKKVESVSTKITEPKVVTLEVASDGGVVAPKWDGTDDPNEFGVKALTSVDGSSQGVGVKPEDVVTITSKGDVED